MFSAQDRSANSVHTIDNPHRLPVYDNRWQLRLRLGEHLDVIGAFTALPRRFSKHQGADR
jgi:hypothetical protein